MLAAGFASSLAVVAMEFGSSSPMPAAHAVAATTSDAAAPTVTPAQVEAPPAAPSPSPELATSSRSENDSPPPPAPAATPPQQVGALSAALTQPNGSVQSTDKAGELFDLLNSARLDEGLPVLRRNAELEKVALVRAENLVANGYFDHYAPDGESAFSELAARGIRYRLAGENLAQNNYPDARTVQAAFDGLIASPGHRANILETRFTQAGVAAVRSGKLWVYVMVFMD